MLEKLRFEDSFLYRSSFVVNAIWEVSAKVAKGLKELLIFQTVGFVSKCLSDFESNETVQSEGYRNIWTHLCNTSAIVRWTNCSLDCKEASVKKSWTLGPPSTILFLWFTSSTKAQVRRTASCFIHKWNTIGRTDMKIGIHSTHSTANEPAR